MFSFIFALAVAPIFCDKFFTLTFLLFIGAILWFGLKDLKNLQTWMMLFHLF